MSISVFIKSHKQPFCQNSIQWEKVHAMDIKNIKLFFMHTIDFPHSHLMMKNLYNAFSTSNML